MTFVHQHEVVALEGIHRHGLLAAGFAQFVNVDDVYAPAGEERTALPVVEFRLDA